jgi:uncharacterized membrane protein
MTLLGTVGGIGGALAIAAVSALVDPGLWGRGVWVVGAAGIIGMLVDSLAGATLQACYACSGCGAVTERHGHCHGTLELIRGVRWLDNDGVNLVGSLTGALAAVAGSSLSSEGRPSSPSHALEGPSG